MSKLHCVRYYDQFIHPDKFRGVGLRGAWIRLLNWVRLKMEQKIHRHVCTSLADNPSIADSKVKSMLKQLELDLQQDELDRARTSPLTEAVMERPLPPSPPRAARYMNPGVNRLLDDAVEEETGVPQRPKRLDNLIAKYAFDRRAKRYASGRRYMVGDPDGDFEPLTEEENGTQKTPDTRV